MKEMILIIEDEASIVHVLSTILTANEYNVILAKTGQQGLMMATSHCPDLILLDLGLPDMDGMEVLKKLREWSSKPVLVVSARDSEDQKVNALDLGADDYITKPFGTSELLARIRTALRHNYGASKGTMGAKNCYRFGGLLIDYDRHLVTVDGNDVHLTQSEFKILELIARQNGRVLTYDYILTQIWGPYHQGDNKILRVNMANIRRKIEKNPAQPQYIFTEVGIGYRMAEMDDVHSF